MLTNSVSFLSLPSATLPVNAIILREPFFFIFWGEKWDSATRWICVIGCSLVRILSYLFIFGKHQGLRRLEGYLPLLENFICHTDLISSNGLMLRWTSNLKIRWTSALSSSSFFNLMGPKFFQIDNLRFELGMTLFLYGAILRERALEVLPAGMQYSFTFSSQ